MRNEQRGHQLQRRRHGTEWHGTSWSGGWNLKRFLAGYVKGGRYFYNNVAFSISCVTIAIMVQPCNSCQSVFTTGRIKFFSPSGLWPQRTPLIYLHLQILLPYLLQRQQSSTDDDEAKQHLIHCFAFRPSCLPKCQRLRHLLIFQALNHILMRLNVG